MRSMEHHLAIFLSSHGRICISLCKIQWSKSKKGNLFYNFRGMRARAQIFHHTLSRTKKLLSNLSSFFFPGLLIFTSQTNSLSNLENMFLKKNLQRVSTDYTVVMRFFRKLWNTVSSFEKKKQFQPQECQFFQINKWRDEIRTRSHRCGINQSSF